MVGLLRSNTLEVLDNEYINLPRLKGLRELVEVGKHEVRNALIPVATFLVPLPSALSASIAALFPGNSGAARTGAWASSCLPFVLTCMNGE